MTRFQSCAVQKRLASAAAIAVSAMFAAGAVMTVSGAALADTGDDLSAQGDRVIVRGDREIETLEEQARDFVQQVSHPVRSFGIARWTKDVCVGVANASPDAAQYVVDRISQVAYLVGLNPGEPGCTANIMIMFAVDGRETANLMVERHPRSFRPWPAASGTNQSLHELETFKSSDAAVRWWQISMPVDRMGRPAIRLDETYGPPAVAGANSRVSSLVRDELLTTLIIVDVSKLQGGANWAQLADYLAMVSLAQIDPDSDTTGYPTVLNLQRDPANTPSLTDWDESYLRALYGFDQYRVPRAQPGGLANMLIRDQRRLAADIE